jgi:hypothetical protein
LTYAAAPPEDGLTDDVLMWREGMRRLHPGRELRIVDMGAEGCRAEAAA